MQRTRKFTHVGPEARRLAALGLSPLAIADRLGVNRSTVQRWMAAGHLDDTRETRTVQTAALPAAPPPPAEEVPALEWGDAIRSAYTLDPTDAKLVGLADLALTVAQSANELPSIRLAAAGRFQSLVKQLASRIRPSVDERPAAPAPVQAVTARADPRALLNPTIQ
jgi:transcriptional regulator with XRE-family HTH domain